MDKLTRLEAEFLHRTNVYFALRRRYRKRKTAQNALAAIQARDKANEALERLAVQEEKMGFRIDESQEVCGSQKGCEPRAGQGGV